VNPEMKGLITKIIKNVESKSQKEKQRWPFRDTGDFQQISEEWYDVSNVRLKKSLGAE
jgi:hypothetical protein